MALKDILVVVASDPACATRLDVAGDLAAAFEAHLTGLFVMILPVVPGHIAVEIPAAVYDLPRRRGQERAAEAERRFRAHADRLGLAHEWRALEGDLIDITRLHARYVDLTIVGQGTDLADAPPDLAVLPEELALGVGRPVLVVPRYGTFPTVGERVLVAWNGSREATRAVNDALPILKRARKVTLLTMNPVEAAVPRAPGADIALHLARHQVTAEAAATRATDIEVGDVLLSYAADIGADLIVMGAYGHSRLREMVLGGATRHVLQHMTVPVLLSH
jgi:nucleotide-binding universal stress UspA family protein